VRSRRAAALVVLAATAAGCGSSTHQRVRALPASGPPNVIRVALADLLWPLEPQRASTRDELVLGRMLFSPPLRMSSTGKLQPGLCTSWKREGRVWRLRCRHAGAIATQLRRVFRWSANATNERTLLIEGAGTTVPYRLTEVAAAPPGVPGPWRLISARPNRVVVERNGVRVDVRRLQPFRALRLFRAGKLDEAPVPLGDIRAAKLDPQLEPALRVRRLDAADVVVFSPSVPADVRQAYDDTADRADYQALVPEFEAPPAEDLRERGQPSASRAAIALREARKRIPGLPKVAVHFGQASDPTLAYGTDLLVAAWRDLGLGAVAGAAPADAEASLRRIAARYPGEPLRGGRDAVPIAWAVDARLVSPRLRGWREDALGVVDYARVRFRASSPSR
jgi:hypothetical protein